MITSDEQLDAFNQRMDNIWIDLDRVDCFESSCRVLIGEGRVKRHFGVIGELLPPDVLTSTLIVNCVRSWNLSEPNPLPGPVLLERVSYVNGCLEFQSGFSVTLRFRVERLDLEIEGSLAISHR